MKNINPKIIFENNNMITILNLFLTITIQNNHIYRLYDEYNENNKFLFNINENNENLNDKNLNENFLEFQMINLYKNFKDSKENIIVNITNITDIYNHYTKRNYTCFYYKKYVSNFDYSLINIYTSETNNLINESLSNYSVFCVINKRKTNIFSEFFGIVIVILLIICLCRPVSESSHKYYMF